MPKPQQQVEEELLSEREVAYLLGLSPKTIRKWRYEGAKNLPFVNVGASIRYRRGDVEAYVKAQTKPSGPKTKTRKETNKAPYSKTPRKETPSRIEDFSSDALEAELKHRKFREQMQEAYTANQLVAWVDTLTDNERFRLCMYALEYLKSR